MSLINLSGYFCVICFRRDKEYCHECRYCCTLSICTTAAGTIYFHTNKTLEKVQIKGLLNGAPTASVGFSTDKLMWKSYDFRCLKPKEGVPVEKWPHYEMHAFRGAKTKEELAKVVEIPFDKYFFNFEDPQVLNDLTDGTENGLHLWKKTYGFDWADWIPGHGEDANMFKLKEHCLEAEYGQYAQNCKRKGGFFKCCVVGFRLDQFHTIRYRLKQRMNLIKDGPKKLYCGKYDDQGFCYVGLGKMHSSNPLHIPVSCIVLYFLMF